MLLTPGHGLPYYGTHILLYGCELHGKSRAIDVWRAHQLSVPVDLRRLVSELQLEVVLFPFKGRLNEMIVDGTIGLRPGLSRPPGAEDVSR